MVQGIYAGHAEVRDLQIGTRELVCQRTEGLVLGKLPESTLHEHAGSDGDGEQFKCRWQIAIDLFAARLSRMRQPDSADRPSADGADDSD